MRMARIDLRRVERAAKRCEESVGELHAAIRAARASGETLRDIAEAAGMSHQRIHQIVSETKEGS